MVIERKILEKWEQELMEEAERISKQLAYVRALLTITPSSTAAPQKERRKHGRTQSLSQRAAEAAYKFLAERGQPVNRTEIFETLKAQGFEFSGDPLKTFASVVLSRDPRFVRMCGRGIWGLAEWQQREKVSEQSDLDKTTQENAAGLKKVPFSKDSNTWHQKAF